MIRCRRYWNWKIVIANLLLTWGAIVSFENNASAQVLQDSTLGGQSSTVTSTGTVDVIGGGLTRGTNLLHSFQEFNVDAGRAAIFLNPLGIENILSRVTGTNPSNIQGILGVSGGNANLFLINPNGIFFGPNAQLSLNGSFVATTANGVGFANGEIFSTNPNAPLPNGLLNVNPSAFFFNQLATQAIVNQSVVGLGVRPEQSLLLVGGEVKLDGGRLQAAGGRVEVGGVAGTGTVNLATNGNQLSLGFPTGIPRANVLLDNTALIRTIGVNGGNIAIYAQNLTVARGSQLQAGLLPGASPASAVVGNIAIDVLENTTLTNSSLLTNLIFPGAIGKGGNVNITTGSLFMNNGARITTAVLGQGEAGDANINARDLVSIDGEGANGVTVVASNLQPGAIGRGGDINISTGSLRLTNGAQLSAVTVGQGGSGKVSINARDTVFLDGASRTGFPTSISSAVASITTPVVAKGNGNSGGITITTGSLFASNSAQIVTSVDGQGEAGDINIDVRDTIALSGVNQSGRPSLISSAVQLATGRSGNINITTGSFSARDGAQIVSGTFGRGDAGNVSINARDTVLFDGVNATGISSAATSTVGPNAIGNGGDVNINARALFVTNGAALAAGTRGRGNSGNVNINVSETVVFQGFGVNGRSSAAFSSVDPTAIGRGGSINITAKSLSLLDSANLIATTRGQGDGGNVNIKVDTLQMLNGGQVRTTTFGSGSAGNIVLGVKDRMILAGSDPAYNARLAQFGANGVSDAGAVSGLFANTTQNSTGQGGNLRITTGVMTVQDGAEVTVSSAGLGSAGLLAIKADAIVLNNQGKLQAATTSGDGGDIDLHVEDLLLLRQNSLISARAGNNGNGGSITINAPFIIGVPTENSDIIANAFQGNGGRIAITAQAIYGLEFRPELTPFSDINASSQFGVSGTVQINTPDSDLNRGVAKLPDATASEQLVAEGCPIDRDNTFVVTGRGGLPPQPGETLRAAAIQITEEQSNVEAIDAATIPSSSTPIIVEAQGWSVDPQGKVVLTASATAPADYSSSSPFVTCYAP